MTNTFAIPLSFLTQRESRLGNNGIEEIMAHPFFADLPCDWRHIQDSGCFMSSWSSPFNLKLPVLFSSKTALRSHTYEQG